MTINLVVDGQTLAIEPLVVQGIPRSGDYIRTDDTVGGQYIVLFAAYTVGQEAVNIHVAHTPETEAQYTLRLNPARA